MFKTLRVPTLLFSALMLSSVLTSCGDKDEDVKPNEYKVKARFTASNLQPGGEDAGSTVGIAFTGEDEEDIKSVLLSTVTATDSDADESDEITLKSSDQVFVELEFPFVDSSEEARALPATTVIKAEILVDGKVKKIVVLDKNSTFDTTSGTLHIEQKFKVGDL